MSDSIFVNVYIKIFPLLVFGLSLVFVICLSLDVFGYSLRVNFVKNQQHQEQQCINQDGQTYCTQIK